MPLIEKCFVIRPFIILQKLFHIKIGILWLNIYNIKHSGAATAEQKEKKQQQNETLRIPLALALAQLLPTLMMLLAIRSTQRIAEKLIVYQSWQRMWCYVQIWKWKKITLGYRPAPSPPPPPYHWTNSIGIIQLISNIINAFSPVRPFVYSPNVRFSIHVKVHWTYWNNWNQSHRNMLTLVRIKIKYSVAWE